MAIKFNERQEITSVRSSVPSLDGQAEQCASTLVTRVTRRLDNIRGSSYVFFLVARRGGGPRARTDVRTGKTIGIGSPHARLGEGSVHRVRRPYRFTRACSDTPGARGVDA